MSKPAVLVMWTLSFSLLVLVGMQVGYKNTDKIAGKKKVSHTRAPKKQFIKNYVNLYLKRETTVEKYSVFVAL